MIEVIIKEGQEKHRKTAQKIPFPARKNNQKRKKWKKNLTKTP